MKKLVALLTAAMMILLLAFSAMPVLAGESEDEWVDVDWDSVDWTTFQWETIEGGIWVSLSYWLDNDAPLDKLLYIDAHCAHAAYAETVSTIMGSRFQKDPQAMLEALSELEPEARQQHVVSLIDFGWYDQAKMVKCLESVKLSGNDTKAGAVLTELIAYAQEETGMTITNPKTGDHSELIAALFLVSTSGIVSTIFWKKELY